MLRKVLLAFIICSGMFVPCANAENFTVLDHVQFVRPFSDSTPIFTEFSTSSSAKSMELVIRFHEVVPDDCCVSVRFSIIISLEAMDPVGNWITLIRDSKAFRSSTDRPIRIFVVDDDLAVSLGTIELNSFVGSGSDGVKIIYKLGEIPRNLRLRFRTAPEPLSPPGIEDLVSFTVSVSGRVFN